MQTSFFRKKVFSKPFSSNGFQVKRKYGRMVKTKMSMKVWSYSKAIVLLLGAKTLKVETDAFLKTQLLSMSSSIRNESLTLS